MNPIRCLSILVIATALVACSGTAPSSQGADASPPAAAPSPSAVVASSSAPPASDAPTTGPEVAIVDIAPTDGALNAIWIGDDTAVAVGFVGPVFTSAIVVFEDGAWAAADVPEASGQVTGIASFADRLIAVGNRLPDIQDSFIWSSPDGHAWEVVETIDDAALHDVVAGAGLIVAVGARLDAEMNATAMAWTSTDGATWEQGDVADGDKTTMGAATATATGFAAVGDRALGAPRPVWTSTDGSSWEPVANDLGDQLLPIDLVVDGDGFAVVGATGRSGDQHPFVARSGDGARWDWTDLAEAEGYASAVAATGDGIAAAGVDADRLTVWALGGGAVQADILEASGAAISALTWDAGLGLVAVGARDGKHAIWRLDGR